MAAPCAAVSTSDCHEEANRQKTKQGFSTDCKQPLYQVVFALLIRRQTVLQLHLLERYAPNSLQLLFHPRDTGNPHFDFTNHLQQYANRKIDSDSAIASVRASQRLQPTYSGNLRRIDLESHQLVGGRVLGRVEIGLASPDDDERNYKILTVPYAEKHLGTNGDAIELVRVIKAAVSAGVEPDPRSLQIWATWAYDEIKHRYARVLHDNPTLAKRAATSPTDTETLAEFKRNIIRDVLTEINTLAMELTAITTTNEDRLFDEPEVHEFSSIRNQQLTPQERKDLFELRYSELFHDDEPVNSFAAELRAICSKLSPAHASGTSHDDEAQFQSFLSDVYQSGKLDDDGLEALQTSHERVIEQWSEGGVVSLHMSDSERFVVEGTLEEDVTFEYLPVEARSIALAIRQSFLAGAKVFSNDPKDDTIDSYIETALDRLYGNPADKRARVNRTVRRVTTIAGERSPFEYTLTKSVYPNADDREYCRAILDILIEGMQRDFILRTINRSKLFRTFYNAIDNVSDGRSLKAIIQDAYQARLAHTINIKMFTTLNTLYTVKRARLDSTLLRLTDDVDGRVRTLMPAVPVIELARTIPPKKLRTLAIAMHTLPHQEPEKISRFLQANRPALYKAILIGLLKIVAEATQKKRMYLRFAFYKNPQTGRPNEPHNMIHLLTAADTEIVWKKLIELSGVPKPATA